MASNMTNPETVFQSLAATFRWSNFYKILLLVVFLGTAFDNMDQVTCSFILPMMRMEWTLNYIQGSYMPTAALFGTCVGAVFTRVGSFIGPLVGGVARSGCPHANRSHYIRSATADR